MDLSESENYDFIQISIQKFYLQINQIINTSLTQIYKIMQNMTYRFCNAQEYIMKMK